MQMWMEQETLYRVRSQVRIMIPDDSRSQSTGGLQIRAELPYATALALLDASELYDRVQAEVGSTKPVHNAISYAVDFPASIVTFIVTASSENEARLILAATVKSYVALLEKQAKEEITRNIAIMESLVVDLSDSVSEKERALLSRQADMNTSGITGDLQRVNGEIMALQTNIPVQEDELERARAKEKQMRETLAETERSISTREVPINLIDSEDVRAARRAIYDIESEIELLAKRGYTEKFEGIVLGKTRLEHAKDQLKAAIETEKDSVIELWASELPSKRQALQAAKEEADAKEAALTRHKESLRTLITHHSEMRRGEQNLKNDQSRLQNYQGILSTLQIHNNYRKQYADILSEPKQASVNAIGAISMQQYVIMLLTGLLFGMVFAYVMELADARIKTEYEVKRYLNLPVLAELPNLPRREEKIISRSEPGSMFVEAFNSLVVVLENSYVRHGERIFMVTSGDKEEGKTTVSSNLAIAFAWNGKKTLLLDGDLRVGALSSVHGLQRKGLSEYLAASVQGETLDINDSIQHHPAVPGLDILTSGSTVSNPIALFKGNALDRLIAELKETYDVIVLDSPPLSAAADGLILGTHANRTLLVSSTMESDRRVLRECKNRLDHASLSLAGVILNKVVPPPFAQYSYYKYRYYHRSNS